MCNFAMSIRQYIYANDICGIQDPHSIHQTAAQVAHKYMTVNGDRHNWWSTYIVSCHPRDWLTLSVYWLTFVHS
jgi:hypothetical protein